MNEQTRKLMHSSDVRTWGSPLDLVRLFVERYWLQVDVCADPSNNVLPFWWGEAEDCLSFDWPAGGRYWMNPVYGDPEDPCPQPAMTRCKKKRCVKRGWHTDRYLPGIEDFMLHARFQALQLGSLVVALPPARVDTAWWQEQVMPLDARPLDGGWIEDGPLRGYWIRYRAGGAHPDATITIHHLRGRLRFRNGDCQDAAPFPSAVVIYDGAAWRDTLAVDVLDTVAHGRLPSPGDRTAGTGAGAPDRGGPAGGPLPGLQRGPARGGAVAGLQRLRRAEQGPGDQAAGRGAGAGDPGGSGRAAG